MKDTECDMDKSCCSWLGRWLCKVGITRSLLVTLALLPFSWQGVVWIKNMLLQIWTLIADKMA
jgi:hypothetical protein